MIYLSPFGFDPGHIVSTIIEEGVGEDDRVVLLTPKTNLEEDRFEEGRRQVERLLKTIGDVDLETVTVDPTDFEEMTLRIADFIEEADEEVFLAASQGPREVLLATVFAGMFRRDRIAGFGIYGDVDRRNLSAELPFAVTVEDRERNMLDQIGDSTLLGDLTDNFDVDKSTVSRWAAQMEKKHLVETRTEGRAKVIEPTFTGRLHQNR